MGFGLFNWGGGGNPAPSTPQAPTSLVFDPSGQNYTASNFPGLSGTRFDPSSAIANSYSAPPLTDTPGAFHSFINGIPSALGSAITSGAKGIGMLLGLGGGA